MPVPLDPGKYRSKPFFNPSDFIGYVRDAGKLGDEPPPRPSYSPTSAPFSRKSAGPTASLPPRATSRISCATSTTRGAASP
jgi:hypothetical protein